MALGVAHTGRVITAAALIMATAFAALIASEVAFVRMFGLGLDDRRTGRRDTGAHDPGAGFHASDGRVELVGTATTEGAARTVRYQWDGRPEAAHEDDRR